MKRRIGVLIGLGILMLIAVGLTFSTNPHKVPAIQPAGALASPELSNIQPNDSIPLPGGCIDQSPGNGTDPVCCISGYVFLNGRPVDGAQVEIEYGQGQLITTTTQFFPLMNRPYYFVRLSDFSVVPGQLITLTARHHGINQSLPAYNVQPDGQQVDIVLPITKTNTFSSTQTIHGVPEADKFFAPSGIAIDSQHNFYIVDTMNDRVQAFDTNHQFLRAWGVSGTQIGEFNAPTGIEIDSSDHIYVVDSGNHRIQVFDTNGNYLTGWGSKGIGNEQFDTPRDLAIGPTGLLYVTDSGNNRVQVFTALGHYTFTIGSYTDSEETGKFAEPVGIAVDTNGNLFVADTDYNRIQKFSADGQFVYTWKVHADFASPEALTIDSNNNLYVTDNLHEVQKFDANGNLLTWWGEAGTASGQFRIYMSFVELNASDIYTRYHHGIVTDLSGDIFVVDSGNHRIQQFRASTEITPTFVSNWGQKVDIDRLLIRPLAVDVDANRRSYIVDSYRDATVNNIASQTLYIRKIKQFDADGKWVATSGKASFITTSIGASYLPDIAIEPNGVFFVLDRISQNVISKYTAAGSLINSWVVTYPITTSLPPKIAVDTLGSIHVLVPGNSTSTLLQYDQMGKLQKVLSIPVNIARSLAVDQEQRIYIGYTSRIGRLDKQAHFSDTWFFASDNFYGIGVDDLYRIYGFSNQMVLFDQNKLGAVTTDNICFSNTYFACYPSGLNVTADGTLFMPRPRWHLIDKLQPPSYQLPIATINHQSHKTQIQRYETLVVHGMGQDSDETPAIEEYKWESNKNGVISALSTLTIAASSLATGVHQIALSVRDGEGDWSTPQTMEIEVVDSPKNNWTMMLYLAGDYPDGGHLYNRYNTVIQSLKTTALSPNMHIALLIDGPGVNDSQRITITTENGLTNTVQASDWFEAKMDEAETLRDFVQSAEQAFPNNNYYLSLADHGQGILGLAWDKQSGSQKFMTVKALGEALNDPMIQKLDILHLDACSMNLLEVAYELKDRADFLLSSQYLVWDIFAYQEYIAAMKFGTPPKEVAKKVINRYAEIIDTYQFPYTFSALNLQRVEEVRTALDHLVNKLEQVSVPSATLFNIRDQGQFLDSNHNYANEKFDMYVDLVDWAENISATLTSSGVQAEVSVLLDRLSNSSDPLIISNQHKTFPLPDRYHGENDMGLERAKGVSIYYPFSNQNALFDLYQTNKIFTFTHQSQWNEFLSAGLSALPLSETIVPTPDLLPPLEITPFYTPTPTSTSTVVTDIPTAPHTPTPTPTFTNSVTPTYTTTPTPTFTNSVTPTYTTTPTSTFTNSVTPTHTPTPTPTFTNSVTPTHTPTPTPTFTNSVTPTYTPTPTPTFTNTVTPPPAKESRIFLPLVIR